MLRVEVPPEDVDLASGLLWLAGATAVEERAGPGGAVTLVAAVPGEAQVLDRLAERWPVSVVPAGPEAHWRDAWRPWATAVPVEAPGAALVVAPPWVAVDPGVPPERVVRIDPGGAFGHGAHPTTRLALDLLARYVDPGTRVLDVGSGSGVLAVVAARLGASEVVAVDVDAEARRATAANAARNRVGVHVRAELAAVAGGFDPVVANLDAPTLLALVPAIVERIAPGGVAVLTGVLAERAGLLADVCAASGAAAIERRQLEDWAALAVRVPPFRSSAG